MGTFVVLAVHTSTSIIVALAQGFDVFNFKKAEAFFLPPKTFSFNEMLFFVVFFHVARLYGLINS